MKESPEGKIKVKGRFFEEEAACILMGLEGKHKMLERVSQVIITIL